MASHLQIQLVEQEAALSDVSVVETILNTDIERKELMEEELRLQDSETSESASKIAAIYNRLMEIHAFEAEPKARTVNLNINGVGR